MSSGRRAEGGSVAPLPVREPSRPTGIWRLWIDTGGTFTDCVATDPAGRTSRLKVLSDSSLRGVVRRVGGNRAVSVDLPHELPAGFLAGLELKLLGRDGESAVIDTSDRSGSIELQGPLDAAPGDPCEVRCGVEVPVLAAHLVTSTPLGVALPPIAMRLATTRATNALLERSGARTVLVITRGFGDLLRIGTQQRPDLFAIEVEKPEPLYAEVLEIDERLDASGRIVRSLDAGSLEDVVAEIVRGGFEAAAVVLLNSYREDRHERAVETALRSAGLRHVSRSSSVAPILGAVARAQTTVVNAYLAPSIDDYLGGVVGALGSGRLRVMTSAGGLQPAAEVRPKDCLLSGPAGGVVGAARAAATCRLTRLISFDMGGTSTDVARYEGEFDYRFDTELAGIRLLAPTLAIETVAAGGGSICRFEGGRLRVGPESAGARPGPACYGGGGPLALTDVNVLLGRLDPARFEIPLSKPAAEARLGELLSELGAAGEGAAPEVILAGLLDIANERMAEAIRRISVRRGYDPTEYTMVAFGGAGGQHACAVAAQLGMETILVPSDASVLSAWGLGHALLESIVERQILEPVDRFESRAAQVIGALGEEACRGLVAQGVSPDAVEIRRRILRLRLVGQESSLSIDYEATIPIHEAFQTAYRSRYGYEAPDRAVELESVRVVASSRSAALGGEPVGPNIAARPHDHGRCFIEGAWSDVAVYVRERLASGARFEGPALVVERFGALVVGAAWCGRVAEAGSLLLTRRGAAA